MSAPDVPPPLLLNRCACSLYADPIPGIVFGWGL